MAQTVAQSPGLPQAELLRLACNAHNRSGCQAALSYGIWAGLFERHDFYGRRRVYPVDVAPHRVVPPNIPASITTRQLIVDYITAHPGCTRVELGLAICGTSTRRLATVLGHLQRMADGGEICATYVGEHLTYTTVTSAQSTT
jgi:hypothetical protein